MPIVITNDQCLQILLAKRALFQAQEQILFLFRNARDPEPDDDLLDYTPADYHGASGVLMNWSADPVLVEQGIGELQADTAIFTPTAPFALCPVYGYFVVAQHPMRLVWAERLYTTAITVGADNTPYAVSPRFREMSIQA